MNQRQSFRRYIQKTVAENKTNERKTEKVATYSTRNKAEADQINWPGSWIVNVDSYTFETHRYVK